MEAELSDDWLSDEWSKGSCHANERGQMVFNIIQSNSAERMGKLLKGGWDVNEALKIIELRTTYENGYPSYYVSTALEKAVEWRWTEGVGMLLDAGAQWHDEFGGLVDLALYNSDEASLTVFTSIMKYAADINWHEDSRIPLLHYVLCSPAWQVPAFLVEYLDLFYTNGGNINIGNHGVAIEYGIRNNCHSNSIRWLLRHGADTCGIKVMVLQKELLPYSESEYRCPEIPLILLQAGMRVTHGAQTKLTKILVPIEGSMKEEDVADSAISEQVEALWAMLEETKEEEHALMQFNSKKKTFPEDRTQQMVDLQGFSDRFLELYPEGDVHETNRSKRYALDQIQRVLEFLSQTQSLQWYCRRCIRENLVSLSPSVVKTLPVAARLKQYILCHEI